MQQESHPLLSPAVLYILISLHSKKRHGYEIMKLVEKDTYGKVRMGPGTLYGCLKRLVHEKLVMESQDRPDPVLDDKRRRYYQLTEKGIAHLVGELKRYNDVASLAKRRNLLGGA